MVVRYLTKVGRYGQQHLYVDYGKRIYSWDGLNWRWHNQMQNVPKKSMVEFAKHLELQGFKECDVHMEGGES